MITEKQLNTWFILIASFIGMFITVFMVTVGFSAVIISGIITIILLLISSYRMLKDFDLEAKK